MDNEIPTQLEGDIGLPGSNLQKKKTKKIIPIVLVLIMLSVGGIVGALYTEVWNPEWNPFKLTRPTPETVITKMALEMKKLKTLHSETNLTIKIEEYLGAERNIIIKAISDVDKADPDNPKSEGEIEFIQRSSEGTDSFTKIGFVGIGQTAYLKLITASIFPGELSLIPDTIKNKWIRISEEDIKELVGEEEYPFGKKEEQKELIKRLIDVLKGKKLYKVEAELPDEEIENTMTYHYLLTLDREEVKLLIPEMFKVVIESTPKIKRAVFGAVVGYEATSDEEIEEMLEEFSEYTKKDLDRVGEITAEVWIGQKDYYLYKTTFEKDLSSFFYKEARKTRPRYYGMLGMILSGELNFSNFNKPVKIKDPEESKNIKTIIEELFR